MRKCEWCSAEFEVPSKAPNKRFCSRICKDRAKSAAGTQHTYTCKHCGKEYKAKKADRATFCSRECSYAWLAKRKAEIAEAEHRRRLEPKPQSVCIDCGGLTGTQNMERCEPCRREHKRIGSLEKARKYDKRDRSPRKCKQCGVEFVPEYGNKRSIFCSKDCAKRFSRQHNPKNFNARGRKAMRWIYGDLWQEHYESINRLKVLERDGWRCKICGCELEVTTEWSERQASVDHIIPLSRGGDHKYSNMRAACQRCNTEKGARTNEEDCVYASYPHTSRILKHSEASGPPAPIRK